MAVHVEARRDTTPHAAGDLRKRQAVAKARRNDTGRDELRLALVLNGGVSLAVWISGVVSEVDAARLRRAEDLSEETDTTPAVYASLCDLLELDLVVDLIAGTSAGGLNGALMAAGIATGVRVRSIRDVWLGSGDLGALLRDPHESEPPSLLKGDKGLLPAIRGALDRYLDGWDGQAVDPIWLILTGTDLFGVEETPFTDSYGQTATRIEYRVQFRFCALPDEASTTADLDGWGEMRADRLARAARTTSSFPFAFEPSELQASLLADVMVTRNGEPVFPTVEAAATRWAVDGGILDNSPIEPMLTTIRQRVTQRPTRRAIVFIVPYAGKVTAPTPSAEDASLRRVLDATFNFPRETPLLDDLERVRSRLTDTNVYSPGRGCLVACPPARSVRRCSIEVPAYRQIRLKRIREIVGPDENNIGLVSLLVPSDTALARQETIWPAAGSDWEWGDDPIWRIGRRVLDRIKDARAQLPVRAAGSNNQVALEDARRNLRAAQQTVHRELALRQPMPSRLDELSEWATSNRAAWAQALERIAKAFCEARSAAARLPDGIAARSRQAVLLASAGETDYWKAQLLLAEVISRVTLGEASRASVDTRYTFMRLCADAPFPGTNSQTVNPSQKLYGLELGHFGGFVRSSWRANDWMWGRLDGATRLVELLLDPTRLREQPVSHAALAASLTRDMPDEDRPVVLEPVGHLLGSDELLEPGSAGAPSDDLRAWQSAWRLRLQVLILREELLTVQ